MTKQLYVTATDNFMSGWGGAEGRISKMVIICDNWEQAEEWERKFHDRSNLKYVNIATKKPYYNPATHHTSFYDSKGMLI